MVFPSVEFVLFFPLVLAISWLLMPWQKLWKPFILVASYTFYAAADWQFCMLLAGVTLGNQVAAKLVWKYRENTQLTTRIVAVAVVLNLSTLGLFKYYGFFVEEFDALLSNFGLSMDLPLLNLALPIGISFIIFQAISYAVDVKKGLIEPSKTVDVAIYLAFFPHLVAGPIVRAHEFLPQLKTPRSTKNVPIGAAVMLICIGLVKKVMIADYLAREVVDPVFGAPEAYSSWDVAFAAYAYTAQIFCDFSGYTDMAIGFALLMGFVFPQNFDRPYSATSFRDFWRRWHITLSRYLRDYVYIPLGGNRGGKQGRNVFLTMLIGGLWHGAAFTFVLWGALHGACLALERQTEKVVSAPAWVRGLIVFHLVVLGWILFRSPTFDIAGAFLGQLFALSGEPTLLTFPAMLGVGLVIGMQIVPQKPLEWARLKLEAAPPVALGTGLAVTIITVGATVSSEGVPPFIYFAF